MAVKPEVLERNLRSYFERMDRFEKEDDLKLINQCKKTNIKIKLINFVMIK